MEKKTIAIVAAIAAVAVLAVASVILLTGDKEWQTTPDSYILGQSVRVGDWIEFDDKEYEVSKVDGDRLTVSTGRYDYVEMTKKEFLSLLTSKKQLENYAEGMSLDYSFNYDGTETINTDFGKRTCKVYHGTATATLLGSKISQNLSLYIGDHGVLYRLSTDSGTHNLYSSLSFL